MAAIARPLPLLLLAVGTTWTTVGGQSISESLGSPCDLQNDTGVCRLINQCESVYEELLAGKRPEFMCGYQGNEPIVCCPRAGGGAAPRPTPTTRPTRPTPTRPRPPVWDQPTSGRPAGTSRPRPLGRPAVQMCSVYAKEVYTLVDPPTLGTDRQQLNVSQCAIKSKKLIVGGVKAEPKEFPHMAAIGFQNGRDIRWSCGGTLISESFVLTAAHCLFSIQWGSAEWVRVGDLNLRSNADDARPQDRRIAERIRHPEYRTPARYNDIALLRLASPVTFNAYVRPACLSLRSRIPNNEKAVACGWGIVDWYDEEGADDLWKVTLPVVSYSKCEPFFSNEGERLPNGLNDNTQLCAGEEGKDTCQGDSGGPLVIYHETEECMYEVIGVTSFGKLCGSVSPGIYTKVSPYLSWIENTVWPNLRRQ